MKKIILITLVLLLSSANFSFAALGDNLRSTSASPAAAKSLKAQTDPQKLEDLKTRANTEIDRRIAALNALLTRISSLKKLSADKSSTLKTQVQADIDGLNTLKTKIDADTDLTTLKTDVKSIVTDYYIFAFFIQFINLNAALETATTAYTNINTVYDKLSARLTEDETAGKEVKDLKTVLTDMKTKLDQAKTAIDGANTEISALTKDGFPGNKSQLLDVRAKLKTARESLYSAVLDARILIQSLKSLKPKSSLTPTLTPTATVTPTPSV